MTHRFLKGRVELVVRINGIDAAFSPLPRLLASRTKVCTSVSLFLFIDGRLALHVLRDVGPGVWEAIRASRDFPLPCVPDWLVLSHAHPDHFLGLDTLVGDTRRSWLWGNADPPKPLRILATKDTFDLVVKERFPYLEKHLEHHVVVPRVPTILYEDGPVRLQVTAIEVKHFRESVVDVFTFQDGKSDPVRVVCLFDIGDFHSHEAECARAGACFENPIFFRPDLLIGSVNTWSDRVSTGHISFLKLAEYLCEWAPREVRVLHYAGYEDLLGEDRPAEYQRLIEDPQRVHPDNGPSALWELEAGMQEHLARLGYLRPDTVRAAHPGETLVVSPSCGETDEDLVAVALSKSESLTVEGAVRRKTAHRFGVPHPTALLIPCLPAEGNGTERKILVHRRSQKKAVSGGKLDICGGHVSFVGKLLDPKKWEDADVIEQAIARTARREANEELICDPEHFFCEKDLQRIGRVGEFTTGLSTPGGGNREYSTLFLVYLPTANVRVQDTDAEGVSELPSVGYTLDDLLALYERSPKDFADGIGRLLERLQRDAALLQELRQTLRR